MEAKKSKKAAIENQRGSWLLMGVIVALAFMFVSFEWTRRDVRAAAYMLESDPIFIEDLIPVTYSEDKLEPPPPQEIKPATEIIEIVGSNEEVIGDVNASFEEINASIDHVWVPPVIQEEKVEEDVIHVSVENMPVFPGGDAALLKYLADHLKYPTISQETGTEGRVIIQFVVDKDGAITSPEVVRGVDPYLDKEAIRVISSMPKWKPGEQNGKKVRVKYTVPVTFRLK